MAPKRIILIRHPETEWEDDVKDPNDNNFDKKLLGQTDVLLSNNGRKQAERIVDFLNNCNFSKIYSSPLKRTRELAEMISKNKDILIKFEDNLKEINFGVCEGLGFFEIEKKYPDVFSDYFHKSLDIFFPKGESFPEFRERIKEFVDNIEDNEDIAIITHGGVVRIILCYLLNKPLESFWDIKQNHGAINILSLVENKYIAEKINYTI